MARVPKICNAVAAQSIELGRAERRCQTCRKHNSCAVCIFGVGIANDINYAVDATQSVEYGPVLMVRATCRATRTSTSVRSTARGIWAMRGYGPDHGGNFLKF